MKFELKIALKDELPKIYNLEGELDMVKTFLKLKVDLRKFKWASIKRVDEDIAVGDVEYWTVEKNRHGELAAHAFAFYEVNAQININAMRRALNKKQAQTEFTELGEGTI